MIEQAQKKRKRKAALITIAFHAVAILIFVFFGLKQPHPLPEEAGASIEFGWDQPASGNITTDIQSTETSPTQSPQTPAPADPLEEQPEEEVATDDESDIAIPKEEEKPQPKPKPEEPTPQPQEEKPTPQLSDKLKGALESLQNQDGGESKGSSETGIGQQGNPQGGEIGGGTLGGGSGSWSLDGRSLLPGFGTKITTTKEEGIVVLNIWVNRNGEVTRVQPNLAESTTTSQKLINLATDDVRKNFKWNPSPNASIEQRGKVRYDFRLK